METTIQQQLKAKLESIGLPYKNINVYGRQIVVTCSSQDAAIKWGSLLHKFAKVRKVALKCIDDAKENKNTVLLPSKVTVYRTYAAMA